MKRIFLATVAALVVIVSASAQRLADVREEATIITDKMISELGIGPGYRNSILNINLAYLNSINSYRDIDSYGWERRNREIRRYLSPGQWRKYCNTYYFYRPIGWQDRAYVHHIYRRYPACRPGYHHRPRDAQPHQGRPRSGPGGPPRPPGAPVTTSSTTIAPASTSTTMGASTTEAMAVRASTTSTGSMANTDATSTATDTSPLSVKPPHISPYL